MPELSTPRGIRDIEPEEFAVIERIREAFFRAVHLYGFTPMEPASIEFLSTLEAKSGPDIAREIYAFKDKAGREVALRFDLTVGLSRFVASNKALKLPVKLASFADMWRYDEPQMGRYRWFYQWDIEIFGVKDVTAEAEVLSFTNYFLKSLGLNVKLHVSDRRLVESYIREKLGVQSEKEVLELIRALDKSAKKPKEELLAEYKKKGLSAEALEATLELGRKRGPLREEVPRLEEEGLRADELKQLADLCSTIGLTDALVLDLSIARGLDYYSGIVFEALLEGKQGLGSLAGGGRYDALLRAFGREDLAAVGVAGGVERTVLALGGSAPFLRRGFFIAYAQLGLRGQAMGLTERLRAKGIPCETDLLGRGLGRQLEEAASKYEYAVILGERELAQKYVTVRELTTGRQESVELRALEDKLVALLG